MFLEKVGSKFRRGNYKYASNATHSFFQSHLPFLDGKCLKRSDTFSYFTSLLSLEEKGRDIIPRTQEVDHRIRLASGRD
jgi:hypothetical protein